MFSVATRGLNRARSSKVLSALGIPEEEQLIATFDGSKPLIDTDPNYLQKNKQAGKDAGWDENPIMDLRQELEKINLTRLIWII